MLDIIKDNGVTWTSLFAGLSFVAQFFVCRVVIANYYWSRMISAVAALETKPVSCRLCMSSMPL